MKITRIGGTKNMNKTTPLIDIVTESGARLRITDNHGHIRVHDRDGGEILVAPCCSNEILIKKGSES